MKKNILLILIVLVFSGCSIPEAFKPKKTNAPVNVNDRVQKNIEEGRGFRLGKNKNSGTFDFASSNELWRASLDVLDFVPFVNASYSGGILITEWFDGNSKDQSGKRDLKITIRFLTNEIRSDAIDVGIHERKCQKNSFDCTVKKIKSKLEPEIKLAILKRAALLEKDKFNKNAKEYRREKGKGFLGRVGGQENRN
mgnify:CR=1 FL=1|tara:strand:+ start:249 stop:836 length:588 start_codon:yes stop_codon:yes gene_type:complete